MQMQKIQIGQLVSDAFEIEMHLWRAIFSD